MLNYFKRLFHKKKKFVFTTRNIARMTGNGERITQNGSDNGLSETYIWTVDGQTNGSATGNSGMMLVNQSSNTVKPERKEVERKEVEPKEVFAELKGENIEFSFDNLDEKVKVVSERIKVLKEHLGDEHLGDEHRTLFYLKNRQKYLKTRAKNPLDWAVTTTDAVSDLCGRYKLRVVPLKQYYTLVPKEGIDEMERYTKAYKAITGDLPIFELVIKEEKVKTEEEKKQKKKDRDPILLANSPLGNFLFVLGAWDDEVEIVDEIIYQGK